MHKCNVILITFMSFSLAGLHMSLKVYNLSFKKNYMFFQLSKCHPYEGKFVGNAALRDTIYRIIADHVRMLTVCLSDGIIPERR